MSEILIWNLHLGIKVFSSNWVQWSAKKLTKVEILDPGRKEIEFLFHQVIVTYTAKFEIPHPLVLNVDQTPLKYALASNKTMSKHGFSSITIEGSDQKRIETGTFAITLFGKFLPAQLSYGGKINQNISRIFFLKGFI